MSKKSKARLKRERRDGLEALLHIRNRFSPGDDIFEIADDALHRMIDPEICVYCGQGTKGPPAWPYKPWEDAPEETNWRAIELADGK